MELAINLFQETEDILSNEERIQEIELPALKEVFGYVYASRNKNMAYTKHSGMNPSRGTDQGRTIRVS